MMSPQPTRNAGASPANAHEGAALLDPQTAETRVNNWLQATFAAGHPLMQAWATVRQRLEAGRLAAEDRPLQSAFTFDQGLQAARAGVHELSAGFDNIPFEGCPDAWTEKPLARIRWYEDGGDLHAGIQAASGWMLAADQEGTVLQELAKAAAAPGHQPAPAGFQNVWTRSGGPVLDGPPPRWGVPFARITPFQSTSGPCREGWALAADQTGTMIEPLLDQKAGSEALPSPQQLLDDPATPNWLLRALRSSMDRDPVKAANEATVLAQVLCRRADETLAAAFSTAAVSSRTAKGAGECSSSF